MGILCLLVWRFKMSDSSDTKVSYKLFDTFNSVETDTKLRG